MNISRFFKDWRILLMIILFVFSIFAIRPVTGLEGVRVTYSTSPAPDEIKPGVIITNINGYDINDVSDWSRALSRIPSGTKIRINYVEEVFPYYWKSYEAYPFMSSSENNETILGISVMSVQNTNIDFGIDVVGGTRIILSPERRLDNVELENVMGILSERLNIYGFKEIPVRSITDLSGKQYITIELPGTVSIDEVRELLENEGFFEARIGNETVFTGDDIVSVCPPGANCLYMVEPSKSGYVFRFEVSISQEGAERFANITSALSVEDCTQSGCYLNQSISFYLDGEYIDDSELRISSDLQGVSERSPVITGGASTKEKAVDEMNKMRSILQTTSLPVSLSIDSIESISSTLGEEFLQNIFFVFLLAIIGVEIVVNIRYKNLKVAVPIIITTISEIIITLGVAVTFKWTFDLSAIAGLIASIGTGVDDQIVITDELLNKGRKNKLSTIKERVKNAFFIVFVIFFTSIAIMIPLAVWGVGMLRGFALTTIIATSVGVLITRPAFSRMLQILMRED